MSVTGCDLTSHVADAAVLLQINFLDQLIIGDPSDYQDSYFSFQEVGLL